MTTKKTSKKAPAAKATKGAKAAKASPTKKAPAKKPVAQAAAKRATASKPEAETKKLSAIDAAAKVLADSGEAMNAKQMIEAMAAKGLWTSPGGKTPHATLYSSIIREIATKGNEARFKKTERGQFAANG